MSEPSRVRDFVTVKSPNREILHFSHFTVYRTAATVQVNGLMYLGMLKTVVCYIRRDTGRDPQRRAHGRRSWGVVVARILPWQLHAMATLRVRHPCPWVRVRAHRASGGLLEVASS